MPTPKEKRSPQYQMRLSEEFRLQLEDQAKKDGDTNLVLGSKEFCAKNCNPEGLSLKADQVCIIFQGE